MAQEAEAPRGRISRLEVTAFKSYRGHNVIGPFKCAGVASRGQGGPAG